MTPIPLASQRANRATVLELVIVWRPPARPSDTQDELRALVIDDLRATLSEDFGQLRDPEGELLTEASRGFSALSPAVAMPLKRPGYLVDRLRMAYQSGADFLFEG